MRERITVSVLVLTLVILTGGMIFRGYSVAGLVRDHDNAELAGDARVLARLIEGRLDDGLPVDAEYLTRFTGDVSRITYRPAGGRPITVVAEDAGTDSGGSSTTSMTDESPMVATAVAAGGLLTLTVPASELSPVVSRNWMSIGLLGAVALLVAGIASLLIARSLSAPFRQLAVAAATLGRGRFDLELPRTRIPEARAIGAALAVSADQLQERLERDRAFAEHASHVLRTPLTGLRLELEDLSLRDDLPEDVRAAAARGLTRVEAVDGVAGQLVELSRRGALVHGADVALRDLATQCAQRWADELAPHDRLLTAAVEGDIDLTYTPGPVEHLLDLLLGDVLRRGAGAVRMVFDADPGGLLRIKVLCAGRTGAEDDRERSVAEPALAKAQALVTALGGRLEGEHPADGLVLRLPRR